MAGFANVEASKVSFETDTQIDAFTAGKKDAAMKRMNAEGQVGRSLERDLIQQGVPLADRRNIIQAATEIEGSLEGTKHSISSVVSGVRKITNNLARVISQKAGAVQNLWGLLYTNLKALQSDSVFHNRDLVSAYAGAYLDAMKNNTSGRYNEISAGVQNASGALTEYLVNGVMPEGVQNQDAFLAAAEDIGDIVQMAEEMLGNAREQLYGNKTLSAEKEILSNGNSNDIIDTSTNAKVSYSLDENATGKKEINVTAIKKLILSIKGRRGIKYDGGRVIRIPNNDMETLRHKFMTEHHYSNRSGEIIDCINCFGQGGKKHYFYIFYVGEDNRVAPIFRLDYEYIERYIDVIQKISNEMGYNKDEFVDATSGNGKGLDRIRNLAKSDSLYDVPVTRTGTDYQGGEGYNNDGGGRTTDNGLSGSGLSNGYNETGNNRGIDEEFNQSIEGEVNENEQGNLLSDGSQQRNDGKRSGEQVTGLAQATERGAKTARERQAYTKGLRKEGLEERVLTDEEGNKHRYTEIKQDAWNDEMQNIADYYGKRGVTVHFLKGKVRVSLKDAIKNAPAMRVGNDIYVSYDTFRYSPQQLAMHEYIHSRFDTPEVQGIKDEIFSKLSTEERNSMLARVKSAYGNIIKDLSAYEEEIVCNILSGMHSSESCYEIIQSFWTNEDSIGQGYSVSQYTESIDAGGKDRAQKFKYMFIGDKAKTANLSALADAKKMHKDGVDAKTIWKETGWGIGLDGKWRSEISDSDAILERAGIFQNPDIKRFKELENKAIMGTLTEQEREEANNLAKVLKGVRKQPKYLNEFLKHDGLFEAYPELADVEVVFEELEEGEYGKYNPRENRIHISKFLNNTEALSTLLHEIQHAIQHIEGFETGINPEKALDFARQKAAEWLIQSNDARYGELIAKGNYADITDYIDQFIKNMYKLDDMNLITRNIYWDSYGEKESRATQERFANKLTTKQRRENYPNNEKGAISKNEGEETYGGNDLSRSAFNFESRAQRKVWENETSRLDVREDAEATNGRKGEEGTRVGSSNISYALDENGMWEMEHIFENDDPEAEAAMMRDWKALLEKYGAIPKGEKPARDIDVPKKTADGRKVSQTVRTILEAKATPDEAIPSIEKMVTDGDFSYDTYTDKQAIADANATIEKKGFATALTDWASDTEKGNVSKEIFEFRNFT